MTADAAGRLENRGEGGREEADGGREEAERGVLCGTRRRGGGSMLLPTLLFKKLRIRKRNRCVALRNAPLGRSRGGACRRLGWPAAATRHAETLVQRGAARPRRRHRVQANRAHCSSSRASPSRCLHAELLSHAVTVLARRAPFTPRQAIKLSRSVKGAARANSQIEEEGTCHDLGRESLLPLSNNRHGDRSASSASPLATRCSCDGQRVLTGKRTGGAWRATCVPAGRDVLMLDSPAFVRARPGRLMLLFHRDAKETQRRHKTSTPGLLFSCSRRLTRSLCWFSVAWSRPRARARINDAA
jgi:hypothetical protein